MLQLTSHHPTLSSPTTPGDEAVLVAMDVEWTKNYRIRNGNIPFCYSLATITIPAACPAAHPVPTDDLTVEFTSAYVHHAGETQALIGHADADLAHALGRAKLLVGHQLSSDLATLTNAATHPPPAVTRARAAWTARHQPHSGARVLDTRYDTDQVVRCTSRRLVDVCTDLGLDVTQPELRGSMTAMHRAWLATGNPELRERLTVLNLRHSLSTALVALFTLGIVRWTPTLNVNRLLYQHLAGRYAWLDSPTFQQLL